MDDNIHKERRIDVYLRPIKPVRGALGSQIKGFDSSIFGLTSREMFVTFVSNGDISLNISH